MTRGDRPAERRASKGAADPLEEALRQIGADILEEPVPERLRHVLRRAQEGSAADPEPAAGNRRPRADGR
ncbi:MAG: hypothetical protein ACREJ0_25035 [Geminicoccaceae bacterium]